jgi:hypothetical protein
VLAHTVVAVLFRARLGLEILVAAEYSFFALAQMAESYAKDE